MKVPLISPLWPCRVRPAPRVSVAAGNVQGRGVRAAEEDTAGARPRLRALRRQRADVAAVVPPSRIVPFKVRPLVTFIFGAKTLPMSSVPSSVTPLMVLLLLTAVRTLPPLVVIVPPMMVPPDTFHPPVRLSSARVLPVLSRVPVTFTVPPVRLNEPAGAGEDAQAGRGERAAQVRAGRRVAR